MFLEIGPRRLTVLYSCILESFRCLVFLVVSRLSCATFHLDFLLDCSISIIFFLFFTTLLCFSLIVLCCIVRPGEMTDGRPLPSIYV